LNSHLNPEQIDELLRATTGNEPNDNAESEHLENARRHLRDCASCQTQIRAHKEATDELALLRPYTPAVKGSMCPPDHVWLDIAAGITHQNTGNHLTHAAQCDHCGLLLRQAKEDFADESTSEESVYVAGLSSTKVDWQRRMARSLRRASEPPQANNWLPSWLGERLSWKLPAIAIIAFACAVIAVWVGIRIFRNPSVDQLLATAYTERRTMEVRIPQAEYAPLAADRGPDESNFDRPPSLSKAEEQITEKLLKNPSDPMWLDARARAEMLDKNYDAAVKTLKRALLTQPDSVRLLTDLGAAYYMRGQTAKHDLDYGKAIEALTQALTKDPNDPIALFNHAYASEKFSLYEQAADDWQHYLRIDPRGKWAREAREHLDEVNRKNEKPKQHAESLLAPKDFPSFREDANSEALSYVAAHSESYQTLALRSWLPETLDPDPPAAASARDARRSLETLATILERNHGDPWLKEFLRASPNPTPNSAIRELVASDSAVNTGRYWHGIELARQSEEGFAKARNQAGTLQARFTLMIAQAFALRYSDCLRTASDILPLLAKTQYHWLQASTFIEQGECFSSTALWEEAIKSNRRGRELAEHAHYPELVLRATAFGASYLLNTGKEEEGLEALRSGLATFWQSDLSTSLGENLYSCLYNASDGIDWPAVDAFALEEMLKRFPSKDDVDESVEREFLASAQERLGDYQAAQETLNIAAAHLDSLPEDHAVAVRRAEIAVARAKIKLRTRDGSGAIALLSPFREVVETTGAGRSQAEYFRTFGEAYLLVGNATQAQPLLQRVLSLRETGLRNLQQEADRLAWIRARGELYHDLLEAALQVDTPANAFALWESYKGASLRPATTRKSLAFAQDSSADSIRNNLPISDYPHDTAIISYVFLRDSIVAFVVRDQGIYVHRLQLPPELQQLAPRFLSLCSDPSSNTTLLEDDGRQLYRILITPLEFDLGNTKVLRIETDGILDQIPFGLLRTQDGNYLGDKYQIKFSQGVIPRGPSGSPSFPRALSPGSTALIVVASGPADSSLPLLPGAELEGAEIAALFPKATLVSGREVTRREVLEKLREAQLLHFAGHAFATFNKAGLVLGPESLLSSQDIATLQLPNLKLAVLSACDTANGEEGTSADLNSIARTLVASGVPDVVASRWRADSTMTRQLMHVFYSNLMTGKTPAESLRAASAAIRSIPAYHHPYYWASFAVFGTS
jgi:CHAT domain-containing protein/Flp pilus assembly protein TadD